MFDPVVRRGIVVAGKARLAIRCGETLDCEWSVLFIYRRSLRFSLKSKYSIVRQNWSHYSVQLLYQLQDYRRLCRTSCK